MPVKDACIAPLDCWTGVVLALFGCYVFGGLGMNIGYHRTAPRGGSAGPQTPDSLAAVPKMPAMCQLQT